MIKVLFGVFMILHGLVHGLYFGHSARLYELQPGMVWPEGSWVFSKLLGNDVARNVASVLLVIAAIGFIAGGIGLFAGQPWWRPVVIGAAVFSSSIFILFWDGIAKDLSSKGLFAILINLAILAALFVFRNSLFKIR